MTDLRPDWVLPNYADGSIANLPATIAALLGAPPLPGLAPLERRLWQAAAPARRVILLVLDAAGYAPFVRCFKHPAVAHTAAITSVFPSTTVAALASLWTGLAPAQHGMLGTRMWLRDYGVLAQMIRLKVARKGYPDQLAEMGLKPETFLPAPNLAEHLAAAGIPTHDFISYFLQDSGLTKILHRGAQHVHLVASLTDAICKLRAVLEAAPDQPMYAHVYHSDVDTIAHFDGPAAPAIEADLGLVGYILQHELLERLSPQAARDTLLIVTADHGHLYTPLDRAVDLRRHPPVWRSLAAPPGGEPRAGYLLVRDGRRQTVREYIERHLAHTMDALDTSAALQAGLWGPPPHHAEAEERLGDMLVVMRDDYWLADPFEETPPFTGWHGGLAADEMRVPLLLIKAG